jgi:Ser/Thr protein kinase RdoA (MazF antagonist)
LLRETLAAQRRLDTDRVRTLAGSVGGEPESLVLIHDGYNRVYRFASPDGDRCLKVTAIRTRSELVGSTDYVSHLAEDGAPVCRPCRWPDGDLVLSFPCAGALFHATMFEGVAGEPVGRECRDPGIYRAWGRALAALHCSAERYRPEPGLIEWSVEREIEQVAAELDAVDEAALEELAVLREWLASQPVGAGRLGWTHGDQNAGNALWDGECVRLIDFDEPMYHWFTADVARPFRELSHLPKATLCALRDAFVSGYRRVRGLSASDLEQLPWLVRLKSLEVYAWRIAELGASRDDEESHVIRSGFGRSIFD